MKVGENKKHSFFKKIGLFLVFFLIFGVGWIWYIFNEKFSDTREITPFFNISALDLIHEFEKIKTADQLTSLLKV